MCVHFDFNFFLGLDQVIMVRYGEMSSEHKHLIEVSLFSLKNFVV